MWRKNHTLKNSWVNAPTKPTLCDLRAISPSMNPRLSACNMGMRTPTLECLCQTAEWGRARQEQGPAALSAAWEAAWEGPAHREGAARRGLLSSLLQAAPGDRQGTCAEFSAPTQGLETGARSRRHEKDLPPGKSCPETAPDQGEPTSGLGWAVKRGDTEVTPVLHHPGGSLRGPNR